MTALAEREGIIFWEALRRADDAPGLASRSLNAITGFVGLVDELQSMVDGGERPDVVLETVLERSGYLAELEGSDDPQDQTRVENLAELVAVAREFADDPVAGPSADPTDRATPRTAPRPRAWPTSSSGSRWWPTPTRSPTPPTATDSGRRHADDAPHRQGPGVPGRLPHRPRGRRLPARPVARRPARARGGAPARLRRRHPRRAAALRLPRGRPLRVGRAVPQPRRRGSSTRCRSTSSTGAVPRPPRPSGAGPTSPPAAGPGSGQPDRRRPPQLLLGRRPCRRRRQVAADPRDPLARPGRPGRARLLRHGHRRRRSRAWPTRPSPRSTSAARASSGCCCATRRSRSCQRTRSASAHECWRVDDAHIGGDQLAAGGRPSVSGR